MDSTHTIRSQLELARRELLDLTARNRLIHTPRGEGRSSRIEIVGEQTADVFQRLVRDNKAFWFAAADNADEETPDEFWATNEFEAENENTAQSQPSTLQTELSPQRLQQRLLGMFYDARSFEEEQGVNILYLAAGFLQWKESENGRIRQAPLILIPVSLDRKSAGARFRLRWSEDEIAVNLSLQAKLKAEFGLRIPDIEHDDELDPESYFELVQTEIEGREDWQVLANDMVLWFYSFSKFLMYRDLCDEAWPEAKPLVERPMLRKLLQEGFDPSTPLLEPGQSLDSVLAPADMVHIVDADSSQTEAIAAVRRGENLVIQGPPGTGKSQTIANIIASAVADGRRVLFVAEKQAALEVVKRRLDSAGVGDVCLELHSHKSKKRAVLEELERTLQLGEPTAADIAEQAAETKVARDELNRYTDELHREIGDSGKTPFEVFAYIGRRQQEGELIEPASLPGVLMWSHEDLHRKEQLIEDTAAFLQKMGSPSEHPWRGVGLDSILPMDLERLAAQLPSLADELEAIDRQIKVWSCGSEQSPSFYRANQWQELVAHLQKSPTLESDRLFDSVWMNSLAEIERLVKQGERLAEIEEELRPVIVPAAWKTNLETTRAQLAAYGLSWFAWFARDYWVAQATLAGVLAVDAPRSIHRRLEILDALIEGRSLREELADDKAQTLLQAAFGSQWRQNQSNWRQLKHIVQWRKQLSLVARVIDSESSVQALSTLFAAINSEEGRSDVDKFQRNMKSCEQQSTAVSNQLQINWCEMLPANVACDVSDAGEWRHAPLGDLADKWKKCCNDPSAIQYWFGWRRRLAQLHEESLASFAERFTNGWPADVTPRTHFLDAVHENLLRHVFEERPLLATFEGQTHEQRQRRFQQLDEERLRMSRLEVARTHYQNLPLQGSVGEVRVLRQEMRKRRRLLPLRKLLAVAGGAVQATKPVFMMSPISVAQYLEPGAIEFDLLVIDEASQVRPVEALGAVARCKQIVVVGDDRQLPPTRFFDKISNDADLEEDFQPGDMESVLDLCLARAIPVRTLCWHYRSRHESLIGVSNHEFYEGKLLVAPSPQRRVLNGEHAEDKSATDDVPPGLSLCYLPDAQFDRGRSACNRVEAQTVADAVLRHAELHPQKTLGVGAFSVAQRNAILEEIETRRRRSPATESFFANSAAEPFFVKNLENIQGDERDVIFISIGYGPDENGDIHMNFGPLNTTGGERRLNVLITRARESCRVFTSLLAEDIDLSRVASRGAEALQTFLHYAAHGDLPAQTQAEAPVDDITNQVQQCVTDLGYECETNIGADGFRLDIAVIDPDDHQSYFLGIECDGSNYRNAKTARDRDRLRPQVLANRGWKLHRIWAPDWLKQPAEQKRLLAAAIESAINHEVYREQVQEEPCGSTLPRSQNEEDLLTDNALETPLYEEATITCDTTVALQDTDEETIAVLVVDVVSQEGPVHRNEIGRRLADAWAARRTRKFKSAIDAAIEHAVDDGAIEQEELFFSAPSQTSITIRDRSQSHAALRKPEQLPPSEIRAAILAVVTAAVSISTNELIAEVGRLLGVRGGNTFHSVVQTEIEELIDVAKIQITDDRMQLAPENASVSPS